MWTERGLFIMCFFTQALLIFGQKQADFKAVDDTNVTTLPIYVEFDQVSLLSCARLCLSTNKTCYSYSYNETTRHCILGSWLVPLNASNKKVQGKIWSSGKFCNTTRNITVLSDGSMSKHDLFICTGKRELCLGVESSDPRPAVTLTSVLQIMCDTVTDGGGWTIFQRRVSGTVDFNRSWTEYKNGFGDFSSGNIWLGNEKIYNLTTAKITELRVDMIFNGTKYFAKYSSFNISNETDGYRLYVGRYTGNAVRDDLGYHNNIKFSTFDVDNDLWANGSCAQSSGWWYKDCYSAHLNGVWSATGYKGIRWLDISNESLSFTEMKFKYV